MGLSSTASATRLASLASWTVDPFHPYWLLLALWQFDSKKSDVYNILWALVFGMGNTINNGPTNTLFFTAGLDDESHGLFGKLEMAH